MKTGGDHLAALRDGRDVYLLGERVADVTVHPAFRNSVASAARLYDFQSAPENVEKMTFASPMTGGQVNRCWQLPTNCAEARRTPGGAGGMGGNAFRLHGPVTGPRGLLPGRYVHGPR